MHHDAMPALNWILPLGISFYTFEVISYLVDVYLGMTRPIKSLMDMALYVSFFPHLIAGPIIRSEDLVPQLIADRGFDWANIREGIARFVWGMVKKIYVADVMAKVAAEVYGNPTTASASALVLGTYAFAVQIYCDFSAYSDMAIGSARMLGIKLPENFDMPYLSCSIREFWRRWHISLSTWLRDYLYIPLGGSRRGNIRTYVNLMLTMLLGGLWHGAGWSWIAWGSGAGRDDVRRTRHRPERKTADHAAVAARPMDRHVPHYLRVVDFVSSKGSRAGRRDLSQNRYARRRVDAD